MTVIDTPPDSGRTAARDAVPFSGVTVRRWTCGLSLIAFPALLVAQALVGLDDGDGATMYAAATEHHTALVASAALLIVSGILMGPGAVGILHQARGRGSALANVAAVFAVLGGIGHVALGFYYVLTTALAGGDPGEMADYVDRLSGSTELAIMAFPLLTAFSLGVLLLPWAAYRAGLGGLWAPIVATLVVLQHLALPPEVPGQEAINTVALVGLTVVFGYYGVRLLRTGDAAWVPAVRR